MFYITPEASDIEEVIKKYWPDTNSDASLTEESSWEILNTNNSQEVLNRHWFKQNYTNPNPQHNAGITYH